VPLDDAEALIRDRLALERLRLDGIDPHALDLAARVLATLHEELCGDLVALAGDRTPRYRRGQLLGEHGMPLEDLAYLAIRRPAVCARALRHLGVEETPEPSPSLADAGARLAEATGALLADILHALEDGRVTLGEINRLSADLDQVEEQVRDARAALVRRRP